jgi:hypothetical protein
VDPILDAEELLCGIQADAEELAALTDGRAHVLAARIAAGAVRTKRLLADELSRRSEELAAA